MKRRWWNGRALGVAILLGPLAGACVGSIGDGGEEGTSIDDPAAQPASDTIGETTRFPRLTHAQWDNTVRALFGFDEGTSFTSQFRNDAKSGGYLFDNDTVVLTVDQALMGAYERAAADVAQLVVDDPTIFDRIVPEGADDDARARAFITTFGEQVYRRPLLAEEVDELFVLYQQGRDAYASSTGLEAGVRLVLEGMLVSPFFLYRVELSHAPVNGMVPLNDWEIASRLSYLLWDTMPDDDLFEAARAGQLRDPNLLRAQIDRMLDDPRATEVFTRMHSQVFGVSKFDNIGPNPDNFPGIPADLSELAKTELSLVIADAYENGRSFPELLTEPRTFVNQDLAPIYGLEASDYGPDFEEVSLDPSERGGVLTLTGFLAANATTNTPDPIHRGLFVSQYLLCNTVPAPPDDIPPLPTPEPNQTNRETIEAITEAPGSNCAACHTTVINPYGFPFEMYDASGAVRTEDRGQPLDLVTSPMLDGEATTVTDALDMMAKVAASDEAFECYAKHITEYLMGRTLVPNDETLRDALAAVASDGSIREVMASALTAPQLTHRAIDTVEEGN